jgi:hydrogenase nickel incorporation protein HypA/HybF
MHEMSLAQGILQVVLDAAEGQRVRKIRLQVGRLQMVTPGSLEFSFRLMAAGTPSEEAMIEMLETPAVLRCGECGAEIELELPPFNCRRCGVSDIEVLTGDEIVVEDDGGKMLEMSGRNLLDYCLTVPTSSIHRIQETHVALYHIMWDMVHTFLQEKSLLEAS